MSDGNYRTNVEQSPPPAQAYDLVSTHFMQLASRQREAASRGLAAAVRPGDTLLIVGHDPSDVDTNAGRWPMPEYCATADELAGLFDPREREMERVESRPRAVTMADGDSVTVHDVIVRARRR